MTSQAINQLLDSAKVWQGRTTRKQKSGLSEKQYIPTGISALDKRLMGRGWPPKSVVEILHEQHGIGELSLVLPALITLSESARWIAFVAPPFLPYAPALESHGIPLDRFLLVHPKPLSDQLWALEQTMRSGTCSAVLAWIKQMSPNHIRRLQLAADAGDCRAFLFRPAQACHQPSPAVLRLLVDGTYTQRQIDIIKCRGMPGGQLTWAPEPDMLSRSAAR